MSSLMMFIPGNQSRGAGFRKETRRHFVYPEFIEGFNKN